MKIDAGVKAGNCGIANSGTAYSYSIAAISFKGVNQATPFINGATASGTTNAPTITPTVSTGDIGVAALATTSTFTVNPTVIFNDTTASYPVAGANQAAGPNPTLSASISIALDWIVSAVSVKAN